ncbi:hypothetical protein DSAG12_02271 [Promethearchaeum syntrophicum]|uniref:Uncharacterized protein n=1 Tax=Promethearchaeum syntrophicum TaxID=2594042 RepID=A0A5B9DBN7_9ARCH|nr:hypothetical protein [Candidatus Prometheoarchaeum syntrophicum]QEE16441.1 hypothetical protein DSAG12_02271 [Candidatus Prometheoarchaeum syntrophicum]
METTTLHPEYTFKITQSIGTNRNLLQNLKRYFHVTKSIKNENTFFCDINKFLPKMAKIFSVYEKQKTEIDQLNERITSLEGQFEITFNEKEILEQDLLELQEYNRTHEQEISEKERIINEQFENTQAQQEIFKKYSRIYITLAIPNRYYILKYFHDTQNNLAIKMVYEHLLEIPEIMQKYPHLSRTTVSKYLKTLAELGFLEKIMVGLYKISPLGTEYYKSSLLSADQLTN